MFHLFEIHYADSIQKRKGFTFETRCQGCEFQLVSWRMLEYVSVWTGFGLGFACFLTVLDVFEARCMTRSAIDGRKSMVLENDAAVTSDNNKIIIFIAIF